MRSELEGIILIIYMNLADCNGSETTLRRISFGRPRKVCIVTAFSPKRFNDYAQVIPRCDNRLCLLEGLGRVESGVWEQLVLIYRRNIAKFVVVVE